MKTKTAILTSVFCAGLLLGVAPLAQANTSVTFQVDMTAQVQGGTFTNGVSSVYVRGSFNGWGSGFMLTNNPSGPNTNLYTGTYDDTLDTNGAQLDYKFTTTADTDPGYESTANGPGDNRAVLLPAAGGTLVLPVQWFSDAGSPVAGNCVFQVDMSQQIALGNFDPNADTVEVQGDFNAWTGGYTLMREGSSDIYTNNFLLAGSPGQVNEFKYVIQPAGIYEYPSALNGVGFYHNRFAFVIPNQVTPVVYFSDLATVPIVTNTFTFSVDMSAPVWSGFFNPSSNTVTLRGSFNNWNTTATVCTNDPNAANTNIYSCVVSNVIAGENTLTDFKFGFNPNSVNNSYEYNATHAYAGNPGIVVDNGNRAFAMPLVSGSQFVLPTVYFNDESTNSVLPTPTTVTFSVNMTNAVGTDSHVFDPNADSVYLNGLVLTNPPGSYAFAAWTNSPTGATWTNDIANFIMTNNPVGSEIYTIQLSIPAGYPVMVSYQYSINGTANENANSQNHVRYIRAAGNYIMPLDVFGSMVQEQSFTNLAIGPQSGGSVPITWLGRPGVHLQVRTNLTSGAWMDVPGTDGQSSMNYPAGADANYFRLINPF